MLEQGPHHTAFLSCLKKKKKTDICRGRVEFLAPRRSLPCLLPLSLICSLQTDTDRQGTHMETQRHSCSRTVNVPGTHKAHNLDYASFLLFKK